MKARNSNQKIDELENKLKSLKENEISLFNKYIEKIVNNISKADLEELEGCPQMTKNAAVAVYRYFHSAEKSTEN